MKALQKSTKEGCDLQHNANPYQQLALHRETQRWSDDINKNKIENGNESFNCNMFLLEFYKGITRTVMYNTINKCCHVECTWGRSIYILTLIFRINISSLMPRLLCRGYPSSPPTPHMGSSCVQEGGRSYLARTLQDLFKHLWPQILVIYYQIHVGRILLTIVPDCCTLYSIKTTCW